MSGTVRTPSFLIVSDFVDNNVGAITPLMMRDFVESGFALVASPGGAKTAAYTAALTDRGTVIPFNVASGAATYTIPPNASVALPLNSILSMMWLAGGVIQPSFVAGAGVTIANNASLTLRVVGSIGHAWQYAANTWYVLGDFT